MAFFDRTLVLAGKVLSFVPQLYPRFAQEVGDIKRSLTYIHSRIHGALGDCNERDHASPEDLLHTLADIHNSLETTLQTIFAALNPGPNSPTKLFELDPCLLSEFETLVAIENQKLRALSYTFNSHDTTILHPGITLQDRLQRSRKVQRYIDLEMQRYGRQELVPESENLLYKWKKLNDASYLKNISGCCPSDFSSLPVGDILHTFVKHMHAAKQLSCQKSDRWIRLMMCSCYLRGAKSSSKYRSLTPAPNQPVDTRIFELGLTLQNYVTELGIDLLGLLIDWPTDYQPPESFENQTNAQPRFPGFADTKEQSSRDSGSSLSANVEDEMVVFKCVLGGKQDGRRLSIRRGHQGSLSLCLDQWPDDLGALREVDLRQCSILPRYFNQLNGHYGCDILLEKKPEDSGETSVPLLFRSSDNLEEFQRVSTGYKVARDYGKGIQIRILINRWNSPSRVHTGKLQIWDREVDKTYEAIIASANPPLTRAQTSISSISSASGAFTTLLETQNRFAFAQITEVDGHEGLVLEKPLAPLLVLFVESSEDVKVKSEDIIAFSFSKDANIDPKMYPYPCKDQIWSRCFIYDLQRVKLRVGRWNTPCDQKDLRWVEVTFSNDEEHTKFTKDLNEQRHIYNRRLKKHIEGRKSAYRIQDG